MATHVRGVTEPRDLESDVMTRFSTRLDRRFTTLYKGESQVPDALGATALGSQDKALADISSHDVVDTASSSLRPTKPPSGRKREKNYASHSAKQLRDRRIRSVGRDLHTL